MGADSGESSEGRPKRQRVEDGEDQGAENEMWNEVIQSEDDEEGPATAEDQAFIDDEGVEAGDEDAGSDGGRSIGDAPQAEEGDEDDDEDEVARMLKPKRRGKEKRSAEEQRFLIDQFMVRMDMAADDDKEANREGRPAIHKLQMLPEAIKVIEKKQLQGDLIERGVLGALKNWLEILPDGSLPNIKLRSAVLQLLERLPLDLDMTEHKEVLIKSGLGKAVMFLCKLKEETVGNRKLAQKLIDTWSRPLFNKTTRWEAARPEEMEVLPERPAPPPARQQERAGRRERGGDDFERREERAEPKPGEAGYRLHAAIPQAVPLDFAVAPPSRVSAERLERQAHGKQGGAREKKMKNTVRKMKAGKLKNVRAEKVSIEGRGLIKYY